MGPGLTPTEVARQACHQQWAALRVASAGAWRADDVAVAPPPDFAQVEMAPALTPPDAPDDKNSTSVTPPRPAGLIEIALSDGTMVRVDAGIDPRALRRVLTALADDCSAVGRACLAGMRVHRHAQRDGRTGDAGPAGATRSAAPCGFSRQTWPTSDILHTVCDQRRLPTGGIRFLGEPCRCHRIAVARI